MKTNKLVELLAVNFSHKIHLPLRFLINVYKAIQKTYSTYIKITKQYVYVPNFCHNDELSSMS